MKLIPVLLAAAAAACFSSARATPLPPRVVVTTDINIRQGDPDDRQSLIHLMWHLDRLDVRLVVADRSTGEARATGALSACHLAVDAYTADYFDPAVHLRALGFPSPDQVQRLIHGGAEDQGVQALIDEAHRPDPRPLWVLVWGNLQVLRDALRRAPDIAPRLHVISIGTFHNHHDGKPYHGANSAGRDDIFDDSRFTNLWWIEDNNIEGMFAGIEYAPEDPKPGYEWPPINGAPVDFLKEIDQYGTMGRHMLEVTVGNDWARYVRAGDTPSVLYLLDPHHDPEHPEQPSWAGEFERPWPKERPNHWTDSARGALAYDATPVNPARAEEIRHAKIARFLTRRPELYDDLRRQLHRLYPSVVIKTAVPYDP